MNKNKLKNKYKRSKNKSAYQRRKMSIFRDDMSDTPLELLLSGINFGYRNSRSKNFRELRKLKLGISNAQMNKKILEIDFSRYDNIREFSNKRKLFMKEMKILQRDWTLNSIINEN